MTHLRIWAEHQPDAMEFQSEEPRKIADRLAAIQVSFDQWPTRHLPPAADQSVILDAYATDIARLKADGGYAAADVVKVPKGAPNTQAMRTKFIEEHTHAEDEVRFFVEGAGAFYLHGQGRVYQVICGAGDLLNVPALTRHWFDMGPTPHFTAIRLFTDPKGWAADFTGDPIAGRFPLLGAAA